MKPLKLLFTIILLLNTTVTAAQTIEWFKEFVGADYVFQHVQGIATDNQGNVYFTGAYNGTTDFDPGLGTYYLSSIGGANVWGEDIYVAKLDADGNFLWAKSIGGNEDDYGEDIKVDNQGNVYITGKFKNTADFDPGDGVYNLTAGSPGASAFILKLNTHGEFIWAKNFDNNAYDWSQIRSTLIDDNNDIIVAGDFSGVVDFDPGAGVLNSVADNDDIFIVRLNEHGELIWAKFLKGFYDITLGRIVFDNSGNLVLSGQILDDVDFDPGPGVSSYTTIDNGWTFDAFVLKLTNNGDFIWVKPFGGTDKEDAFSVIVDNANNIIVSGNFEGTTNFGPGSEAFNFTSNGEEDMYILKLDANGEFLWANTYGGTGRDDAITVEVDIENNIYVAGNFESTITLNPSGSPLTSVGSSDLIFFKLTDNGDFVWHLQMGGPSSDDYVGYFGHFLVTDGFENIYLAGQYKWGALNTNPMFDETTGYAAADENTFIVKVKTDVSPLECFDSFSNISIEVCDNYTVPSGNNTHTETGIYTDVIPNTEGCDSIITINLTINTATSSIININECDGYTSPSGNEVYLTSGVYNDVIANTMGCDSLITINLTLNNQTSSTINITECESYTLPSGSNTYNESGTYFDVIPNANNCDSVITINLEIENFTLDTDINQSNGTLNALATADFYQWIDCNTNLPINGATSQSFTPTEIGEYALVLHQNSCSETTDCYSVSALVGIDEVDLNSSIKVFPNPVIGENIFIYFNQTMDYASVKLFSTDGRLISENQYLNTKKIGYTIHENGLYLLKVTVNNQSHTYKILR